jgi:hypothetical protein
VTSPLPTPLPALASDVVGLSAGDGTACAVLAGGELRCWGHNQYEQLGPGTGRFLMGITAGRVAAGGAEFWISDFLARPGSRLAVTALDAAPVAPLSLTVNGHALTGPLTSATGRASFTLETQVAEEGIYRLAGEGVQGTFWLLRSAPLREREAEGPRLIVEAGWGEPLRKTWFAALPR